jgi:hypothetical protein
VTTPKVVITTIPTPAPCTKVCSGQATLVGNDENCQCQCNLVCENPFQTNATACDCVERCPNLPCDEWNTDFDTCTCLNTCDLWCDYETQDLVDCECVDRCPGMFCYEDETPNYNTCECEKVCDLFCDPETEDLIIDECICEKKCPGLECNYDEYIVYDGCYCKRGMFTELLDRLNHHFNNFVVNKIAPIYTARILPLKRTMIHAHVMKNALVLIPTVTTKIKNSIIQYAIVYAIMIVHQHKTKTLIRANAFQKHASRNHAPQLIVSTSKCAIVLQSVQACSVMMTKTQILLNAFAFDQQVKHPTNDDFTILITFKFQATTTTTTTTTTTSTITITFSLLIRNFK